MQTARINTFGKVVITVFLLLIPVVCLYSYSNLTSVSVVKTELEKASLSQLSQTVRQMDETINQLFLFTFTLSRDPSITDFADIHLNSGDIYDNLELQQKIAEKLTLQSAMSKWQNQLVVYSAISHQLITSSMPTIKVDKLFADHTLNATWRYRVSPAVLNSKASDPDADYFVRDNVEPFSALFQPDRSKLIIEVMFPAHNISNELDLYKRGGKGDPFLYSPGHQSIMNHTANVPLIKELTGQLEPDRLKDHGSFVVDLYGEGFLVNVVKSESLGWYMIDYLPLEQILAPITTSRNLFYLSMVLLLFTGILASFLIYRHVQRPILTLIRKVRRLAGGDYSTRISKRAGNEFDYLFDQFNDMAMKIQELVENVLQEKIRSRDAILKQLQSQINPHFLYNCLYFIVGMTKLGEKEAVIAMANNLGDYYKYSTRVDNPMATVAEEVELVDHYLSIQNLRMQRIDYEIDIPPRMMDIPIPRLLLQPIVENAIIHGFEEKQEAHYLWIVGEYSGEDYQITVEDDGPGMEPEALARLQNVLKQHAGDEIGTGLLNVHRRLHYNFGGTAGIEVVASNAGGLQVTMRWKCKNEAEKLQGDQD
ncbi:two-component system sensor histidine kinase YesM [Paenibacillus rhizosphaerae]|uniref:Two-component system sensor histidine kinase YesM n=1 Tax=Paenibacillus rhizosphaerae TaxID=297318 RepID=A0A839TJQ3_9BACL|nr:sensor histidine kinase [Paenibacillus rhizosphaerae]MBB3127035.1 two-component system sensor histidine kinase YesM [Paenibacillus rhizosphaerae]